MQAEKQTPYLSFILRCWQEQPASADEPAIWRFELQPVVDEQERRAFGTFEALIDFLQSRLQGDDMERCNHSSQRHSCRGHNPR